jgi:hypothetical protein
MPMPDVTLYTQRSPTFIVGAGADWAFTGVPVAPTNANAVSRTALRALVDVFMPSSPDDPLRPARPETRPLALFWHTPQQRRIRLQMAESAVNI